MLETLSKPLVPDERSARSPALLWKRYALCSAMLSVLLAIDLVWLHVGGYSVQESSLVTAAKTIGMLLGVAAGLAGFAKIPRYRLATQKFRYPEAARMLLWLVLLLCFMAVAGVLSYLCVTVNAPVIDASLIRFDQALGFDWLGVYRWTREHAAVQRVLSFAYDSGGWQLIGIPAILGLLGRDEALADFVMLLILSSILLLLVSTPFPATSAYVHFNVADPKLLATVSDFERLRNGTLRQFDLTKIQGLVSFPSFHTALGVFFVYSVRRVRVLFPIIAALDVAMVISTPTQGGHYLVDVFGGLILAFATVQILARMPGTRTVERTRSGANAAAG